MVCVRNGTGLDWRKQEAGGRRQKEEAEGEAGGRRRSELQSWF